MRRIDVILIGIGILVAGGGLYILFQSIGFDSTHAGIWSQAVLVGGLVIWLLTYLGRVLTQRMTYDEQLKRYEDAVLQKRLEELTPEELEKLQRDVDQERLTLPSDEGQV
jgi:hypothetical protein